MKVFAHYNDVQPGKVFKQHTVITIGNFDGLHLGHQTLLKAAQKAAQIPDTGVLAVTFWPNPKMFFSGSNDFDYLFTPSQKRAAFAELGIDGLLIQAFDHSFSETSANDFYAQFLRHSLHCKTIIVGDDFRFGKSRSGDTHRLKQMAQGDGVTVQAAEQVMFESIPISSSRIRDLLKAHGDVEKACAMLGRPYVLDGIIKPNAQIGSQLGFPTANLNQIEQVIPKPGVYAGYVWLEGIMPEHHRSYTNPPLSKLQKAVINIGFRPTIATQTAHSLAIEAHLLDFKSTELYNKKASFYLCHRIRDEQKFSSREELKQQIADDIKRCRILQDAKG